MAENPDQSPAIELKVERIAQLFHTLDPEPFRERDLDKEAEEFIVGWARELPRHRSMRIVIHLPQGEMESASAKEIDAALNQYFAQRGDAVTSELRELFRIGRYSLLIGLAVLAFCLMAARFVTLTFGGSEISGFVREGLLILGWVANWRPLEIFLYDWWPLVRRRSLYRRLATALVLLRTRGT